MNRITELARIYRRHVGVPWQGTLAGAERVMMIVYPKEAELHLRARIGEFEQATLAEGRRWTEADATRWFARWMAEHEYRDAYFATPELLDGSPLRDFHDFAVRCLKTALEAADEETVVALTGAASLYGFMRVSDLVHSVESRIPGRLAVFFPGTRSENNYRLLDARDGWSYMAQPITLNEEWIP